MLLRSFASTELRGTAERGKHTSRLKLLSSIIQKDWRPLALGTVLCQALLQPPPLPESAKPALFPAELQFGWRAMPIHPRLQLCPTAPSEKSEESKLSSQRTEMLLHPTWKQVAESANEMRRLLSLPLIISPALWNSQFLTTTLQVNNEIC